MNEDLAATYTSAYWWCSNVMMVDSITSYGGFYNVNNVAVGTNIAMCRDAIFLWLRRGIFREEIYLTLGQESSRTYPIYSYNLLLAGRNLRWIVAVSEIFPKLTSLFSSEVVSSALAMAQVLLAESKPLPGLVPLHYCCNGDSDRNYNPMLDSKEINEDELVLSRYWCKILTACVCCAC